MYQIVKNHIEAICKKCGDKSRMIADSRTQFKRLVKDGRLMCATCGSKKVAHKALTAEQASKEWAKDAKSRQESPA